jgi:RNA polymerase sigma-70 factor (ECF subfamily)
MGAPAIAETSDQELVDRVLAGDRAAFEPLVRRHNQRMYRAARAVTRSDSDAEDALQQAWLKVYKNLSQFRGDASFSSWSTRIAVHEAIASNRKRTPIAEVVDIASDQTPDTDLGRAQLGALLESCLSHLPQGNREVMVMRDVLELDTAETADLLGLSHEAVRVRLHRARAAVAATLTDLAHEVYKFDGARCERITKFVMCNVLDEVDVRGA